MIASRAGGDGAAEALAATYATPRRRRRERLTGGGAAGGWDAVGSTGAYTDASYSIVVPTLADSNSAGIHRATYLVRAATATPAVYYDSPADSGYSKDDLPPAQPAPFAAAYIEGAAQLHWGANVEPDFWYYRIYRGESVEFVPDAGHLIATRSDTGYVDAGPPGRTYKLSAVDVNGNEGGYALRRARHRSTSRVEHRWRWRWSLRVRTRRWADA